VPEPTLQEFTLCGNESVTLDPLSSDQENALLQYTWSNDSTSSQLVIYSEGIYSVTISNDCDQSETATALVNLVQPNAPCDDNNPLTSEDQYNDACECVGFITNVEEEPSNSFAYYPNPANDFITIQSQKNASIQRVLMFDAIGKCVMNQRIEDTMFQVDVKPLNSGLYTLVIVSDSDNEQVVRFTKM
jgi:hypothetical protein